MYSNVLKIYSLKIGPKLCSIENYVQKLQKKLKWSFNRALEVIEKQKAKYKSFYEKKVRCTKLEPGDLV